MHGVVRAQVDYIVDRLVPGSFMLYNPAGLMLLLGLTLLVLVS